MSLKFLILTSQVLVWKVKIFTLSSLHSPPPPNVIYSRFWYAFSMLKLTKFSPPYGGLTFYYTSHDMNRFIPHVYLHGPWTGSKTVRIWLKIE